METIPLRRRILDTIVRKSTLKQKVFDNTFWAFNLLKDTLLEMASEMDDEWTANSTAACGSNTATAASSRPSCRWPTTC